MFIYKSIKNKLRGEIYSKDIERGQEETDGHHETAADNTSLVKNELQNANTGDDNMEPHMEKERELGAESLTLKNEKQKNSTENTLLMMVNDGYFGHVREEKTNTKNEHIDNITNKSKCNKVTDPQPTPMKFELKKVENIDHRVKERILPIFTQDDSVGISNDIIPDQEFPSSTTATTSTSKHIVITTDTSNRIVTTKTVVNDKENILPVITKDAELQAQGSVAVTNSTRRDSSDNTVVIAAIPKSDADKRKITYSSPGEVTKAKVEIAASFHGQNSNCEIKSTHSDEKIKRVSDLIDHVIEMQFQLIKERSDNLISSKCSTSVKSSTCIIEEQDLTQKLIDDTSIELTSASHLDAKDKTQPVGQISLIRRNNCDRNDTNRSGKEANANGSPSDVVLSLTLNAPSQNGMSTDNVDSAGASNENNISLSLTLNASSPNETPTDNIDSGGVSNENNISCPCLILSSSESTKTMKTLVDSVNNILRSSENNVTEAIAKLNVDEVSPLKNSDKHELPLGPVPQLERKRSFSATEAIKSAQKSSNSTALCITKDKKQQNRNDNNSYENFQEKCRPQLCTNKTNISKSESGEKNEAVTTSPTVSPGKWIRKIDPRWPNLNLDSEREAYEKRKARRSGGKAKERQARKFEKDSLNNDNSIKTSKDIDDHKGNIEANKTSSISLNSSQLTNGDEDEKCDDASEINEITNNPNCLDQLIGKYDLQGVVDEVKNYNLTEEENSILWTYCVDEIHKLFNQGNDLSTSDNEEDGEAEYIDNTIKDKRTRTNDSLLEETVCEYDDNGSKNKLKSYEKKGILRFFLSSSHLIDEEVNDDICFSSEEQTKTDENNITSKDGHCRANYSTNNGTSDDTVETHSFHICPVEEALVDKKEDKDTAEDVTVEYAEVTRDTGVVDAATIVPNLRDTDDQDKSKFDQQNESILLDDGPTEADSEKNELVRDEKVIYNASKSNNASDIECDLKQLLLDLCELDTNLLSEKKHSYTDLLPKPFSDEDTHPIHQKHYEILKEDVQASLYQFDSNFHKYVAKAYSYENNMLDMQFREQSEPTCSADTETNRDLIDFDSPPDYPSKNTHYELSGDVLLLQDMLRRALGEGEPVDNDTIYPGDEIKTCDQNVDILTQELVTGGTDNTYCDTFTENDSYDKIKHDLLSFLAKQETDLFQIRGKINEIEIENDDNTPDDVTSDVEEDEIEISIGIPDEEKKKSNTSNRLQGKENGDKEEYINNNKYVDQKPIKNVILQNSFMKNKRTKLGFTLRDCVSLYERVKWYPNEQCGILACDADCYIQHMNTLCPYIARLHHGTLRTYVFALNKKSLKAVGSIEHLPNVLDCAVDVRRSLTNEIFPLAYSNRKETQRIKNILKCAFRNVDRNGVTTPFSFSDKDIIDLVNRGIIKLPPDEKSPLGSSIYKENAGKVLAILNYQEHIRVICSSRPVDLKRIFEDAASLLNILEEKLRDKSQYFAWDDTFGYLNSNPEHLGMACCLSIRASFAHFDKNTHLTQILSKFGIEVASSEYNQKLKKVVYTLKNRHQFGCTELDMLKNMMEGVRLLSTIDYRLEEGRTFNDLLDEL